MFITPEYLSTVRLEHIGGPRSVRGGLCVYKTSLDNISQRLCTVSKATLAHVGTYQVEERQIDICRLVEMSNSAKTVIALLLI